MEGKRLNPEINMSFYPDTNMKNLYYIYLILCAYIFCLSWMIPIIYYVFFWLSIIYAASIAIIMLLPLLITVFFVITWIPKYYNSIKYTLTNDELIIENGVYWKRKSFVPYNRITNIDIIQGPLARKFRLGTIRIQTAGYSASKGSAVNTAEAIIYNVKNFEEIKDLIISYVRKNNPIAVEAEVSLKESINQQILNELRKIRETIEKD